MPNCGIEALQNMTSMKNVSMFTLIHLAKDNGVNLYFCKVEDDELLSVVRPAIFHQKGHFVFVKNGEAMPKGSYTGYVLTSKPPNEPLPFALAKKIHGGKKARDFLAPVVGGLVSIINPMLGAAVGAGLGAYAATKNDTNPWMGALTGGLMAAGAGAFGKGAIGGFKAATGNILGKASGALTGGVKGVISGVNQMASGVNKALSPNPIEVVGGHATPVGYGGTVTIPGFGTTGLKTAQMMAGGSGYSLPGFAGGSSVASGGLGLSGGQLLGLGATALLKPPTLNSSINDNYAKSAQYLGLENYQTLPTATRKQLEEYTNTPLDQLATKFYAPDDKGLRMLDEKHQQERSAIETQYANYGQDPFTSSDAQRKLTEIDRQYTQAKAEYQQQIQNEAMKQAIDFKKEMLQRSMEQGQFDYNAAMELATYMGRDQELKYAMETKNYDMMQQLLAEIFQLNTGRGGLTIKL